jgi:hypothetical protein
MIGLQNTIDLLIAANIYKKIPIEFYIENDEN